MPAQILMIHISHLLVHGSLVWQVEFTTLHDRFPFITFQKIKTVQKWDLEASKSTLPQNSIAC